MQLLPRGDHMITYITNLDGQKTSPLSDDIIRDLCDLVQKHKEVIMPVCQQLCARYASSPAARSRDNVINDTPFDDR